MDLQLWDSLSNPGCIEGFGAQQLFSSELALDPAGPGQALWTNRCGLTITGFAPH